MANVLGGRAPWHRDNRPGILSYAMLPGIADPAVQTTASGREYPKIPRLNLSPMAEGLRIGGKTCLGGGAVGAYRLSEEWRWTAEVSGCGFRNLPKNWNGDSLTFMTGPEWTAISFGRLNWSLHSRVGGQKITEEHIDPLKKKIVEGLPPLEVGQDPNDRYRMYATAYDTTGFSLSVGGGLQVGLTRAFGLQVANVEYVHSWLDHLNGTDFNQGLRITAGLTLHLGNW